MTDARTSGRDVFDRLVRGARGGRPPARASLERARRPSQEDFERHRARALPVLVDGLSDDWPARSRWSLANLRARFGERVISVIATRDGCLCTDVNTGVVFRTMRFGDYVDVLARDERPDCYLIEPGAAPKGAATQGGK